jgi:putative MATE family efflux protein
MKDMTQGGAAKLLIAFTLPMLFGNVFQQLYNVADSIIVGRFSPEGSRALAAVMVSFPVLFIMLAIMQGLAGGATVIIAQYYGAKNIEKVKTAIATSAIVLFAAVAALSVAGVLLTPQLLRLIRTDPEIIDLAATYLRVMFGGALLMLIYNLIAGYMRALGDTKTPLYFLIAASVLNILLDLLFILVLGWGVAAVAAATLIAQAVSGIGCIIYAWRKIPLFRFERKEIQVDKEMLRDIVRVSIPSTIQQGILSAGFLASQGLINSFGTNTIAGVGAAFRVEMFALMPVFSFGMAIATFAGQNMGAGDLARVREGVKKTLWLTTGVCVFAGAVLLVFGRHLIGIFFNPAEAADYNEILRIGVAFLSVIACFFTVMGVFNTLSSMLRGVGDIAFSTVASAASMAIRLGIAYVGAAYTSMGIMALAWAMPIGWGVGALVCWLRYISGAWEKKGLVRRGGGLPPLPGVTQSPANHTPPCSTDGSDQTLSTEPDS